MYSTQDEFKNHIGRMDASELVEIWMKNTAPHAFSSAARKLDFFRQVFSVFPDIEDLQCAGTANWKYSLNPKKGFRAFTANSDIDLVAISEVLFLETWERMRMFHRLRWYELNTKGKKDLRRNGENVYSGFVSPEWIPEKEDEWRFRYLTNLDRLANSAPGFRKVNMYFFRNWDEAKDYYKRGIELARRTI